MLVNLSKYTSFPYIIPRSETPRISLFHVLPDPHFKITRDTCIKYRIIFVSHNINVPSHVVLK